MSDSSIKESRSACRTAEAIIRDLEPLIPLAADKAEELQEIIIELLGYAEDAMALTRQRLPDDRLTYIRSLRNELRKRGC